jgi:hypothetical protein
MSVDLCIYLARPTMPSPEQWANAIRFAGFPVELDRDFNVDTQTGFLPCLFEQSQSGFEYFSRALSEKEQADLDTPHGCDFAVTLVTHSDLRETATALIAAGVLCKLTGGIVFDPQTGASYTASTVLNWVQEQLVEIERYNQSARPKAN